MTGSKAKTWGVVCLLAAVGYGLFFLPDLVLGEQARSSGPVVKLFRFGMGLPAGFLLASFGVTRALHPFFAALAYAAWPLFYAGFFLMRALYVHLAQGADFLVALTPVVAVAFIPILFVFAFLGFLLGTRLIEPGSSFTD